MHDPNFEKTVQQKMEELQFHPAESVWINIEKAVAGQRHRRGLAYFWRFALPVILAAAVTGGYYLTSRSKNRAVSTQSVSTQPVAASGVGPVSKANTPALVSSGLTPAASGASATTGRPSTPSTLSGGSTDPSRFAGAAKTFASNNFSGNNFSGKRFSGRSSSVPAFSGRREKDTRRSGSSSIAGDPFFVESSAVAATATTPAQAAGRKAWFYQPALADQRQTQAIRAAKLNNKKTAIAIAGLQKKVRPWEAGFVAGGGISRLNRLNGAQAAAALSFTAVSFYRISGSSQGNAYISDVRSNAAFSGGVYLQKAIADRWIFNTGMTLHYYSSGITIGQQVNTYVQPSASFVNPTSLSAVPSAAVYSAGNSQSYTNRYYFLELPVNLQWQVNKSHLLPLFLEGGFSLARLMSANALLYDSETGVYSKQGDQINKTQLYVSTSFMAGLPFHGLHVEVGPQVQYGLTPIVNGHSLGDQHFFYAGIKLVVIPGKK